MAEPTNNLLEDASRATIVTRTGELQSIPSEQMGEAESKGSRLASPEELQEYRDKKTYGEGAGNTALAGLAGALDGATLGISSQLLTKSGLVERETLRGLADYQSGAFTTGQVLGSVAPILLPGGAAAGAGRLTLGAGAKGAVRSIGVLPRGATALGQFTERQAAKALVGRSVSSNIAVRALAKTAPKMLGQAVEGSIYGLGTAISEDALGRQELNAETALASMGMGALFGAAPPALVGAATPLISVPARKAAQSLHNTAQTLKNFLGDVLVDKGADLVRAGTGAIIGSAVGNVLGESIGGVGAALAARGDDLVTHQAIARAGSSIAGAVGTHIGAAGGILAGRKAEGALSKALAGNIGGDLASAVGDGATQVFTSGLGAAATATATGQKATSVLSKGIGAAAGQAGAGVINSTTKWIMESGVPGAAAFMSGTEYSAMKRATRGVLTGEGAAARKIINATDQQMDEMATTLAKSLEDTMSQIGKLSDDIATQKKMMVNSGMKTVKVGSVEVPTWELDSLSSKGPDDLENEFIKGSKIEVGTEGKEAAKVLEKWKTSVQSIPKDLLDSALKGLAERSIGSVEHTSYMDLNIRNARNALKIDQVRKVLASVDDWHLSRRLEEAAILYDKGIRRTDKSFMDNLSALIKESEASEGVAFSKAGKQPGAIKGAIQEGVGALAETVRKTSDPLSESILLFARTKAPGVLDALGLDNTVKKQLAGIIKRGGDDLEMRLAKILDEHPSLTNDLMKRRQAVVQQYESHLDELQKKLEVDEISGGFKEDLGLKKVGTPKDLGDKVDIKASAPEMPGEKPAFNRPGRTQRRKDAALLIQQMRDDYQKHLGTESFYGEEALKRQALYDQIYPYRAAQKRLEKHVMTNGKVDPEKLKSLLRKAGTDAADASIEQTLKDMSDYFDRSGKMVSEFNKQELTSAFSGSVDEGMKHVENAVNSIEDIKVRNQFKAFREKNPFMKEMAFMALAYGLGGPAGLAVSAGARMLSNPALMVRALQTMESMSAKVASDMHTGLGNFLERSTMEARKASVGKYTSKVGKAIRGTNVPLAVNIFHELTFNPENNETKHKSTEDAFFARLEEIEEMMANPELAIQRMAATTQGMNVFAPGITTHVSEKAMKGIQFLYKKAPMVQEDFFGKKIPPSQYEMRKWAKYMKAVHQPMSVIEEFSKDGTVNPEGLEVLREIYPELHTKAVDSVIQLLPKLQKELTHEARVQLTLAFGIPVEKTMRPGMLKYLQKNASAQAKQSEETQGAPAGSQMRKGPRIRVSSQMETKLNRIEQK